MARYVYYCYRKGKCLVGRSDIAYHSIPFHFTKEQSKIRVVKYFTQYHIASECQRQDVNSVFCDSTFYLLTVHHADIDDASMSISICLTHMIVTMLEAGGKGVRRCGLGLMEDTNM